MNVVKAKVVDPTHLELADPIEGPSGRTVLVSVAEPEEDAERRVWLEASAQSLAAAYGEAEPEYSLSLMKERNPDFAG